MILILHRFLVIYTYIDKFYFICKKILTYFQVFTGDIDKTYIIKSFEYILKEIEFRDKEQEQREIRKTQRNNFRSKIPKSDRSIPLAPPNTASK